MFHLSSLSNTESSATGDFIAFQHTQLDICSCHTSFKLQIYMPNQHLMGQPPMCPLTMIPMLIHRGGHQCHRLGRAGSRLGMQRAEMGWSGGTPLWVQGHRGGPAWGGSIWRRVAALPDGAMRTGASWGHCSSRAWGYRRSYTACHHVAVTSFPGKITQWLKIPLCYTSCSAEEDEIRVLIYWYSRT